MVEADYMYYLQIVRHVFMSWPSLRDLQGIIDSTGKMGTQMQGFLTASVASKKANTRKFCKKWNKRESGKNPFP